MIQFILQHYIISTLLLLNFTWIYFAALVRLRMIYDEGKITLKKNPLLWILTAANLVVGFVYDTLVNIVPTTIVMLELPKWGEWLTTDRLCRIYASTSDKNIDKYWRRPIASWIGSTFLDDIDPTGKHIK